MQGTSVLYKVLPPLSQLHTKLHQLCSQPVVSWIYSHLSVVIVPLGILVIGGGIIFTSMPHTSNQADSSEFNLSTVSSSASATPTATQTVSVIKIDIDGAVQQPGVKTLKDGDRVEDALNAAGGMTDQTDKQYVAQNLNLAQHLVDGDKIYIPAINEQLTAAQPATGVLGTSTSKTSTSSGTGSNSSSPSKPIVPSGPVSINRASESELESLPGIGPAYAQKIIDGRPYGTTSDLCTKKVVRSDTCQKIQSLITL